MFNLLNPNYVASSGVTIADNTVHSFSGASKRIKFINVGDYVDLDFAETDFSLWEELSLAISQQRTIEQTGIFKITVEGVDYTYDILERGFNQILIDVMDHGSVATLRITALVSLLELHVDYVGLRKVDWDQMDLDILNAVKAKVALTYNHTTTLSAAYTAGDKKLSLTDSKFFKSSTGVQIGAEERVLVSNNGELDKVLTGSYSSGETVSTYCPVEAEDYADMQADPIVGITIDNAYPIHHYKNQKFKNSIKQKKYITDLTLTIYIDCGSKKTTQALMNEYNDKYGERFAINLDGEKVDLLLEDSNYLDKIIGNNMRVSYSYKIKPQPVTQIRSTPLPDANITIVSRQV